MYVMALRMPAVDLLLCIECVCLTQPNDYSCVCITYKYE